MKGRASSAFVERTAGPLGDAFHVKRTAGSLGPRRPNVLGRAFNSGLVWPATQQFVRCFVESRFHCLSSTCCSLSFGLVSGVQQSVLPPRCLSALCALRSALCALCSVAACAVWPPVQCACAVRSLLMLRQTVSVGAQWRARSRPNDDDLCFMGMYLEGGQDVHLPPFVEILGSPGRDDREIEPLPRAM